MPDSTLSGSCDYSICQGACCYDGAYLLDGEQQFLQALVERYPEVTDSSLTSGSAYLVPAIWDGEPCGFKTATRPHSYTSPAYPKHFAQTRCVFSDAQGWCRLETLAKQHGLHKWAYKPATCWLFPLSVQDGEPVAPPTCPEEDPYYTQDSPGFASALPCGKPRPDSLSWKTAFKEEIKYLKRANSLPLLDASLINTRR